MRRKSILKRSCLLLAIVLSLTQCTGLSKKPVIYIIGDSTVKNGQGDGARGLWGWGDFIPQFVDTSKIKVENHALGGTSSRTFHTKGLWTPVLEKLEPGDYVFIQFGHNDGGKINDSLRARGTIKGIGDEFKEINNILSGEHEIVHSYGWYIRQFILEAKIKGAIPVVFSPIPRNDWMEGRVPRNDNESYGEWAKQVADSENVIFIDLNNRMAGALEEMGEDKVTEVYFFKRDHTHTTAKGAILAASKVIEGIQESKLKKLKKLLLRDPQTILPTKKNVFLIGDSTVADGTGKIVGWGKLLNTFFVHTSVTINNKARGGRSSRSFSYEGLWKDVYDQLQPGDVVIMQFGHNDGGSIDKEKFRGSLKGIGDETENITRPDGTKESVHTYGWYIKKYISETREKGAVSIVLSQPPRNRWTYGQVDRVSESYGKWAMQAAEEENSIFLDLNDVVASKYEKMGADNVALLFTQDNTHTTRDGAYLNALTVSELILKCKASDLRNYIVIPKE